MNVKIENYQNIKKAEFEIEGLTILTGGNNLGKTSSIRAIRDCCFNYIKDNKIKKGTDELSVTVDTVTLKRKAKGAEKSRYYINGEEEAKMGQQTFPKVSEELNIKKIKVKRTELTPNFWFSNEAPFLTDKTDQEKYELLLAAKNEKFVNILEQIKKDSKEEKDKIKEAETKINESKKRILEKEEELEKIKDVDVILEKALKLEEELKNIEELKSILEKIKNNKTKLNSMLDEIEKKETFLTKSNEMLKEIIFINEKTEKLNMLKETTSKINTDKEKIVILYKKIKTNSNKLDFYNNIRIRLGEVVKKIEEKEINKSMLESLNTLKVNSKELNSLIKKTAERKGFVETELDRFKEEIGFCPLCNNHFHIGGKNG